MNLRQNHAVTGLILVAVCSLAAQPLMAAGDPTVGREKAQVCQACHGPEGKSVDPSYPNLAGQHQSYLVKALADYRSGARNNAIMQSFAAGLSNQDIEDLAAWFASQKGLRDLSVK